MKHNETNTKCHWDTQEHMLEDTRLAVAPLKPQLEQDFLWQVSLKSIDVGFITIRCGFQIVETSGNERSMFQHLSIEKQLTYNKHSEAGACLVRACLVDIITSPNCPFSVFQCHMRTPCSTADCSPSIVSSEQLAKSLWYGERRGLTAQGRFQDKPQCLTKLRFAIWIG